MALESNLYALWAAKQNAKGAAAANATKRLIQVAGDVNTARDDGSENYSDLDRFGDAQDFVNTIVGEGSPGIQATPDVLAYITWLFFGGETVTGAADPWTHVNVPLAAGGFYSTLWKRVGGSIIEREKFNDCRFGQLQIEGSTGAKVLRVTPTVLSLDPGEKFAADPAVDMPTEDAFLYTEAKGTFTINGVVFPGQSAFTGTWDEALTPYYGDDTVPHDLITGTAAITVAVTVLVDTQGHQEFNRQVYGTTTPAAGDKPTKFPAAVGAYSALFTKQAASGPVAPARSALIEYPGIKWAPDVAIPPNPDGGAVELGLAGAMRKVVGQPGSRITTQVGVPAYTV